MSDAGMEHIYCLHCGQRQQGATGHWSVGSSILKAQFSCPGCGWLVEVKAQTVEFMVSQMVGGDEREWPVIP